MSCWCVVGVSGRNPVQTGGEESVDPELIEANSYRILRSRIDLSHLPPFTRAVTERMIYVSADFDYATDLVSNEGTLAAAVAALAAGAPVVADAAIVASAIRAGPVICKIDDPLTRRLARVTGLPPAAAAVRLALGDVGPGAIWVVGVASAALEEIIQRGTAPALVIGMPAGFVGAAEAKQALRASGLPSLTNVSEKGGAAVAAAAADALLRAAAAQSAADGPAPAGPSAAQTT
jgi:precorrin-8X/cobalt-precorrin-8 methylmutase